MTPAELEGNDAFTADKHENRPVLVIVSGPPASGKTTLASALCRELGLPLFAKDAVKERIADCFEDFRAEQSPAVGLAAILLLYDVARELIAAGQSVMLESYFHHGKESELGSLTAFADAVLIHCTAPDEVLYKRYVARNDQRNRHGVHRVGHPIQEMSHYQNRDSDRPLDLPIPRLIVSTESQFPTAEDIAPIVRDLCGGPQREIHWP